MQARPEILPPLATPLEKTGGRVAPQVESRDLSHVPTILVVEDNPVTRKLVRVSLGAAAIEVAEAATGREAIALLRERNVDLILRGIKVVMFDNGFR